MVTTIVPPHWKPSNLSFFFLIMFNSKKSSTTQNFKKVFIKISCEVFPFPIFPPFKKTTRFVWGENEFNPSIFGAERFPGVALCGLPRTSQLRHGVDEVQSAKGAPRFKNLHGGGLRLEDFSWRFFFFCSKLFFESSEVSKFESVFWYLVVVFDLLFLIDICCLNLRMDLFFWWMVFENFKQDCRCVSLWGGMFVLQ